MTNPQKYNAVTYREKLETFKQLGHSYIYLPCIYCKDATYMQLFHADHDEMYRTCDTCLVIEKIS